MSSDKEYVCALCGGTFDKGWSDEESVAELEKNFPEVSKEECYVVCDDCYKEQQKRDPGRLV